MSDRDYFLTAEAPVEEYMRYYSIPRNEAARLRSERMKRKKEADRGGSNEDAIWNMNTGGRIGYALGGNEMLRDSRQGLGSMMAADDSEMRVPTDMIDDPAGSFETDPMELREEIDREGMLRTAAMDDPMLGYLIQTYDELKDMGQLDPKYMGPQGLEDFIKIEGPMLIQAMQQREEQGAGIASLRA